MKTEKDKFLVVFFIFAILCVYTSFVHSFAQIEFNENKSPICHDLWVQSDTLTVNYKYPFCEDVYVTFRKAVERERFHRKNS